MFDSTTGNQRERAPAASPRYPSRYEAVVDELIRLIQRSQLQPGARLPSERELAGSLDVSRTSLRQALTVLRVHGLVDVRPGAGIYLIRPVHDRIRPISPGAVDSVGLADVMDLREASESYGALLAAQRRTDADIAELASANEQMAREIERGEIGLTADRRFHRAVMLAAHSPRLLAMTDELDAVLRRVAGASLSRAGQPPRSLSTHRLIVEAIVLGDAEQARRVMLDHLLVTEIAEAPHQST